MHAFLSDLNVPFRALKVQNSILHKSPLAQKAYFLAFEFSLCQSCPPHVSFCIVQKAYYRLFQFSLRRSGMLGLIYLHLKLL